MNNRYPFSVYSFTEKEIEQICDLVKRWAAGDTQIPIDGRKLSKQVKTYALGWELLERRKDQRLYVKKYDAFLPRYYLPVEALWRLVQPMLAQEGSTGYSIVNHPLWEKHFNTWVQNSRFASDHDLCVKEDILLYLSSYHYINFQMCGSVWSIYREAAASS